MKIQIAELDDSKELFKLKQNKDFQKFFPKRILSKTLEEQQREIKKALKDMQRGRAISFIIKEKDLTLGFVEIYKINKTNKSCAIGFGVKKSEWNKGYATKAIKQVNKIIKEMGFHTMEATVFPGNTPSERVLEKNEFTKVGIMKDYYYTDGKYLDRILYWKVLE